MAGLALKTKRSIGLVLGTVLLMVFPASVFAQTTPALSYQGRILDPNGDPVEAASVQFRIDIRSPLPSDCRLYQETRTVVMTNSNGFFKINLNDGSGSVTGGSLTLDRALSNRTTVNVTPTLCGDNSGIYTPGAYDTRKMTVFFNDGSGWETMPAIAMNFVPTAIESLQVGGFKAANLLRVQSIAGATGVPENINPLTKAQYDELMLLLAGTSIEYEHANELAGEPLPALSGGESIYWNGSGWTAYTPVITEADPSVEAFAKDPLPTCAADHFLRNDGTGQLECVATPGGGGSISITTGTGLTGGPITGTGNIELATVHGSGGTGAKVTYDVYGRVTATGSLVEADIPTLDDAGKVVGSAITSGEISGSTSINTSGNITTTGEVYADSLNGLSLILRDTGLNTITLEAPVLGGSYVLVLPTTNGTPNQLLSTDGNGILSWVDPASLTETDPKVGTLTNTKWCTSDGTQVICNTDAPVAGTGDVIVGGNTVLATMVIGTNSNHALEFETNGTTKVNIDAAGRMGIGVTGQTEKLEVDGTIKSRSLIVTSTVSGSTYSPSSASTSPSSGPNTLHLANAENADSSYSLLLMSAKNTATREQRSYIANIANTGGGVYSPDMAFGTELANGSGYQERMRIAGSGNVGIGETAPARVLHVGGPIRITATTGPGTPALGDIYVDSGDSKLKYHNGTGWVDAGGAAAGVSSVGATAPIVSSGGATPDISLNLGDGLTTVTNSLALNLGNGLEFNTGAVRAKAGTGISVDGTGINVVIGDAAGEVMGADSVPECDPDEKLQMSAGPTFTWSCVADLGITSESDPKVGTLTNTKWCTSDGSQVINQG